MFEKVCNIGSRWNEKKITLNLLCSRGVEEEKRRRKYTFALTHSFQM